MPTLPIFTSVLIHEQETKHHKKWNKTCRIVEILQIELLHIPVHGSGRTTKQNRRFLKPYGTQNTIPTALQPSPFLQSPISPATHQNSTPHTDYNMINPNRTVIINHRHHISCPHYITPAASSCSTTTSTKTNPTCT